MPVISAAVAAVGAAIATTTVATVATAAAAVGTVVGMAGLATSVIGMVTKNQGLMKAGKIMGYVGVSAGVGGWLTSSIAGMAAEAGMATSALDATDDLSSSAVDDFLNFADDGGQMTDSVGNTAKVGADGGMHFPQDAPSLSVGDAPKPVLDATNRYAAMNPNPLAADAPQYADQLAKGMSDTPLMGTVQAPAAPTPAAPSAPDALSAPQVGTPQAPSTPQALGAPTDALSATAPTVSPSGLPPGAGVPTNPAGLSGLPGPAPGQTAKSFLDGLPDWAKMSMMSTGAQGISGLASGWFQGQSAEERLNFEKQIRDWQQRNGGSAPLLSFGKVATPKGMVSGGAR